MISNLYESSVEVAGIVEHRSTLLVEMIGSKCIIGHRPIPKHPLLITGLSDAQQIQVRTFIFLPTGFGDAEKYKRISSKLPFVEA